MTTAQLSVLIAAITLFMALSGGLIGLIWMSSSTLTQMTGALAEIRATIAEMRSALTELAKIPLHEQRISQLESAVSKLSSEVRAILQKLGMHSGELRAVRHRLASQPNLGDPND